MIRSVSVLGLLAAIAVSVPVSGAEITLYQRDGFAGRSFTANQSISNFDNVGFNDHASSAVVKSGSWQLCSDAYFRGRCVTLGRGEYASLRSMGLDNSISSAREIDWAGERGGTAYHRSAQIELFDNPRFGGNVFAVNGAITNFSDVGFNDRARSMIVHEGRWEACEHADFRGVCETFGPGRYADLGPFGGRMSSIRPVGVVPGGGPGGPGGIPVGGWGQGARAVLYENPNLSGRALVLDHEVAYNLATTGFNDRAASLRIEGGYWVFCSDANFGGECLTFGPGDYPTLPWGLARKISSGRRVSEQYPYNQSPRWAVNPAPGEPSQPR